MIKPTVGRHVLYTPHINELVARTPDNQPHAAIIAAVHNDRLVNLSVFDANGVQYARQNVQLLQEDDAAPDEAYAEWMPYQKEQAYQPPEPLIGLFGGSPRFSGAHDIGGGVAISGADLLDFAFAESGLNADQWNALAGEDIDEMLDATLDRIRTENRSQMAGADQDDEFIGDEPVAVIPATVEEVVAEPSGNPVETVVADPAIAEAVIDERLAEMAGNAAETLDNLVTGVVTGAGEEGSKSEDPVT